MLKQIIVPAQKVDAYMHDRQRIPLTVMSFDIGVHELVIPIVELDTALITNVLAVFKLLRVDSVIQTDGVVVDDKVHVVIPHQLNGYKGRFTIEIDLQLTNNRSLTLAQFDASARLSDIDNFDEDLKPYYFALFDELATEVKVKRTDAIKEIVDETNDGIVEIGVQVGEVDKAKTAAIQNIEDKVELVETSKTTALNTINQAVDNINDAKTAAINAINAEQTIATNAVKDQKTTSVNEVSEVAADATREIELKEAEVESAKNLALDNIATSEQTAYDAFFAYAEKQTADVLLANLEYIAQVDQRLLQTERKATDLSGYSGQVTLTNTETYPFNNSGVTVPISKTRYHLDYNVNVSVVSETGGFAGEVIVYDKQLNGFKIKFTGSAKNVTVKYLLTGGMYK